MQITVDVPEKVLAESHPSEIADRIKLYAALMMFQSGELSAGLASQLAGLDRYTFLGECKKHGIPALSYDPDELASDLQTASGAAGG
ncbi:MAG: UPF0175 family protein [Acidobacteriota bacterium]